MNIKNIFLMLVAASGNVMYAKEVLVNEIRAIIYHKGGSVPISDSDLKSLDGHRVTLRDAILRQLMVIDGQQFSQITDDDVERTLVELQRANGLSRDGMMHAFEMAGFSKEEGFEEIKRQQIVSQVLEVRVRSDKRLIIQKSDVEEYDNRHPAFIEPVYTLQQVCIPLSDDVEHKKFTDAELAAFHWEEPFEVKAIELADDKQFIADAEIGAIVSRERVDEGLELTRLVRKTARERVSLEKRYDEIMDIARRERFMVVLREFQQSLLDRSSIWFSHQEDRDLVMEQPEAGATDAGYTEPKA